METFLQLEASAAATNNNPLINLVRDMVSTLKKSAAALVSAPNADKLDPQTIVCKCKFWDKWFVHPIFLFWFLVTFGNKVAKIQEYNAIFVYILQGKMERNYATKVTKIPKTKI